MGDLPKFKFICDACGSMSITVEHSDRASETTIVKCGRCSSPRGTLAALRYLARSGRSDLFEFLTSADEADAERFTGSLRRAVL